MLTTLWVVAIHYCLGHAWMAFIGNTPLHALRMPAKAEAMFRDEDPRNVTELPADMGVRIKLLLLWAVVPPLTWVLDAIICVYQRRLPKL